MKRQILLFSTLVAACYGDTTRNPLYDRPVGGIQNMDPKDPKYLALAWNPATAAVNKHLKEENPAASVALVPLQVVKATRQVVGGFKYELDIQMTESICKIGANTVYSAKNCPIAISGGNPFEKLISFFKLPRIQYRVKIIELIGKNQEEVYDVTKISPSKPSTGK